LEKRFERGAFFLKPIRLYAASFSSKMLFCTHRKALRLVAFSVGQKMHFYQKLSAAIRAKILRLNISKTSYLYAPTFDPTTDKRLFTKL
jgi:hypothetical protein